MPFFLALMFLFIASMPVAALESAQPSAAGEVKGDVMYWEEGDVILKEMSGNHQRLHVTADTKMVGVISKLKPGDKVVAQVDPDGNARTITLVTPDTGGIPGSPGRR